jgi:hypothetical protein
MIEEAKKITDVREKRKLIREIENVFDDIMSKY